MTGTRSSFVDWSGGRRHRLDATQRSSQASRNAGRTPYRPRAEASRPHPTGRRERPVHRVHSYRQVLYTQGKGEKFSVTSLWRD